MNLAGLVKCMVILLVQQRLEFSVGNWSFDKANWRTIDMVNRCWAKFPDPPDPSEADQTNVVTLQRDLLSI
ncbi:putative glycosyltransferase HPAT/SRGT1 [Helianthus annuus]|nr:putative glycosyltransferase HPAT/SRGT1 [Helianthus annuus]KAJ0781987.1 putative glycosyltransferase HPAT/SRGT1 [Helianthus annuus]